jgi:hypothetical protein
MTIIRKIAGAAGSLIAALLVANMAQAQSQTPAAASAPAASNAPQPVGANEIFARWDRDHSKTLSLAEFKAGWDQIQANLLVKRLHETFVAMDTNKDGTLEASEYANLELVRKAGASAPPMSTFDTNKSQTLDFKEYLGFVQAMVKSKP